MAIISSEYKSWIGELKQRIRQSQVKAAVKVNTELLQLYWGLGKDIVERQLDSSWGSGFFNQLSKDLKSDFPQMSGFSPTNLKYMKRFYLFYNQDDEIRQQVADELDSVIFRIPWFHQVYIIPLRRKISRWCCSATLCPYRMTDPSTLPMKRWS